MKVVDWPVDKWNAGVDWSRRHSRHFDHFWRAHERYDEVHGGRLAAAIAYYGFFAVFALALVAYSVIGYVLASSEAAMHTVNSFLAKNIPFLDASQIADARNTVAIAGLIGLVLTGAAWIESMRSSQRAIWHLDQQPGMLVIRRLVDLGIMLGIGLLLGVSLWIQNGVNAAVAPLLLRFAPHNVTVTVGMQDTIHTVITVVGGLLGLLINGLVAAALLSGVSRLRMSPRRLLPSALLVAVGLSVLSSVGRFYINYSKHRPAFQVVGGTVAILLFLYLFNQMLLFGAALAATSGRGEVMDLAAGPPAGEPDATPAAETAAAPDGARPVDTAPGVPADLTAETTAAPPADRGLSGSIRRQNGSGGRAGGP